MSGVRRVRSFASSSVLLAAAAILLLVPARAHGDGYEMPNLHSARSVGMGSTAIGWLDGPLALPENPAGISHTGFIRVAANLTLMLAQITGSPARNDQNVESDVLVAPLPTVAASFRVLPWMTLALGTYPVALAGADYAYETATGQDVSNKLTLLFWEISPAVSFDVPGGLKLGAGYRVTFTTLTHREAAAAVVNDYSTLGVNWTGFRLGAQYSPHPAVELGLVYRHRVDIETEDEDGRLLNLNGKVESDFTLPTMIGGGVRGNLGPASVAVDVQYGLHSEAERSDISIQREGASPVKVPNLQRWDDGLTVKAGIEYRLLDDALSLRAGYFWDQNTTQAAYPSPWGTPPGDTHSLSLGVGYDGGPWALNVAWANRFGEGKSTAADKMGADACPACGFTGDYALDINGIHLDFEWAFGGED